MGKCNLSVHEQEGGSVGGVAEGVRWASVIYPSVNELDNNDVLKNPQI